jgi:hypothetical protein
MAQRPDTFTINRNHPLQSGWRLGIIPSNADGNRSLFVRDSSPFQSHGRWINRDGSTFEFQNYSQTIGRLYYDFSDQSGATGDKRIVLPSGLIRGESLVSMATWFHCDNFVEYGNFFNASISSAANWRLGFGIQASVLIAAGRAPDASGYTQWNPGTTLSTGVWYHAAYVVDVPNDTIRIYLNGNLLTNISNGAFTNAAFDSTNSASCTIGGSDAASSTEYLDGKVSDLMIWLGQDMSAHFPRMADPSNVTYDGFLIPPKRQSWNINWDPSPPTVVSGGNFGLFMNAGAGQRPEKVTIDTSHRYAESLVLASIINNPGQSPRMEDLSAYETHGITNGERDYFQEIQRCALKLTGASSQYLRFNDISPHYWPGPLTIAAWFRQTSLTGDPIWWELGPNFSSTNPAFLAYAEADGDLQIGHYQSYYNTAQVTGAITAGNAYHLAVTHDLSQPANSEIVPYLNGVIPSFTKPFTTDSSTAAWVTDLDLFIGSRNATSLFYTGLISDLFVWNRAIPDAMARRIADPSNTMYDGMLKAPPRKLWNIPVEFPVRTDIHVYSHTRNRPTNGQTETSVNIARPDGVVNGDLLVAVLVGVGAPQDHKLAGWTKKSRFKVTSLWCETYSKVANNEPSAYTVDWAATYVYGGGAILCIKGMTNPKHYATNSQLEAYTSQLTYPTELAADEPNGMALYITTSEYGYNGVLNNLPAEYERIVDDAIGEYLGLFTKKVSAGAVHQPAPISSYTTTFQTSVARFAEAQIGAFHPFVTAGAGQRPDKVTLNKSHGYASSLVLASLATVDCSASKALDISPYQSHGITDASFTFVNRINRSCLKLSSGQSNYLRFNDIVPQNWIGPLTIAMWLRVDGLGGGFMLYELGPNATTTNPAFYGYIFNDGGFRAGHYPNLNTSLLNAGAFTANSSVHFAAIHDVSQAGANEIDLYMNGDLASYYKDDTGNNTSAWANDLDLFIGCRAASSMFSDISVADLFLWNARVPTTQLKKMADPSNTMYDGMLKAPPRKVWNVPWNPDQTILDTAKTLRLFANPGAGQRPEKFVVSSDHKWGRYAKFAALASEHSNAVLVDSSRYGNHGSWVNMNPDSDWVFDKTINRWAIDFNAGVDQYIGGDSNIHGQAFMGMSLWFKTTTSQTAVLFEHCGQDGASVGCGIHITPTGVNFRCATVAGGGSSVGISMTPHDGNWHHVLGYLVPPGGSWGLYVDGAQAQSSGQSAGNVYAAYGKWTLGQFSGTGYDSSRYTGLIADPFILNTFVQQPDALRMCQPLNTMYDGMIIPPQRTIWNIPFVAGVGGGSFQSAWASNLNIYQGAWD